MRDEKHIIKCPYCGAEYLPSEIFFPEEFLPNVKDVIHDDEGKIVAYRGYILGLSEEYVCDKCNHTFTTTAELSFTTSKCEEHDFDTDYTSKIYTNERTELSED